MKSITILFNIVLIILSPLIYGQNSPLDLKIYQNNKEVIPTNQNIFILSKNAFTIQFEVKNLNGFLVGITQDEDVYQSAIGEGDLEVAWFSNTGMAEELFNKNYELLISNDAPSYWYYEAENDHRFDKTPTGNTSHWFGKRTVKNLYNVMTEKTVGIKKNTQPIYMFFYTTEYMDDDYKNQKINLIRCLEIIFK